MAIAKYGMDLTRMRRLAGLYETNQEDDEALRLDDERIAREKKIEVLIRGVFKRLNIEINYNNYSVHYDEENGREAMVVLEDEAGGIPINQLARLYESGLSKDFRIAHFGDNMVVRFIVDPNLDHAI